MAAPEPMPPPNDDKKVKLTCYLPPAVLEAIQIESVKRKMTLGELVEEAFRSRMVKVG